MEKVNFLNISNEFSFPLKLFLLVKKNSWTEYQKLLIFWFPHKITNKTNHASEIEHSVEVLL